jgi:hypothetical protein
MRVLLLILLSLLVSQTCAESKGDEPNIYKLIDLSISAKSTNIFRCEVLFMVDNGEKVIEIEESQIVNFRIDQPPEGYGTNAKGTLDLHLQFDLENSLVGAAEFSFLGGMGLYILHLDKSSRSLKWEFLFEPKKGELFRSKPSWTKYGYCLQV